MDITNIVQLHNLRVLIILSNRWDFQVKNINNLQNLVNLEVLEIKHDGNIDVSFVRPLKNLNTLGFRNSIINNVSPLLELPQLTYLYLDDSRVRDFSPLLKHPSIISITGFILDDGYAWSPVYDKFEEQGIEFWARTYDR